MNFTHRMLVRSTVLAAVASAPAGIATADTVLYTDQAAFEADAAGLDLRQMYVETFEENTIEGPYALLVPPLESGVPNNGFPAGLDAPNLAIDSSAGLAAVIPNDFWPNIVSTVVGTHSRPEYLTVHVGGGADAVGFEVWGIRTQTTYPFNEVAYTIRGTDGAELAAGRLLIDGLPGGFMGVVSTDPIGSVEIAGWTGTLSTQEYVDNVQTWSGQLSWALDRIDQPHLPLDGNYDCDGGGHDVPVYVVGSGIRQSHDDFGGRARPFYDFEGGSGDDCNGLGTWAASLVGGREYGAAEGATLYSVRVAGCRGSFSTTDLINGIEAIVDNREPPGVVILTVCAENDYPLIDNAVVNAVNAGFTVIAPACCSLSFDVEGLIGVGGTDVNDHVVACSTAELYAPADQVPGAWYSSDTATRTLSEACGSAALTAGVAAEIISTGLASSPPDVERAISEAAVSVLPCPSDVTVDGLVDFADILRILSAWGPCEFLCVEDIDGNGVVDFGDILLALASWGECPDGLLQCVSG